MKATVVSVADELVRRVYRDEDSGRVLALLAHDADGEGSTSSTEAYLCAQLQLSQRRVRAALGTLQAHQLVSQRMRAAVGEERQRVREWCMHGALFLRAVGDKLRHVERVLLIDALECRAAGCPLPDRRPFTDGLFDGGLCSRCGAMQPASCADADAAAIDALRRALRTHDARGSAATQAGGAVRRSVCGGSGGGVRKSHVASREVVGGGGSLGRRRRGGGGRCRAQMRTSRADWACPTPTGRPPLLTCDGLQGAAGCSALPTQ